ncbi:hypothetical protein BJ508DRAFT_62764 [Ascobolus immersus RN42]|uniref:Uncharacterized protein n=1 Tax=Ascobolus immersus RN42 TaxID=1160509 RepID=A0A3N4IPD1_ASCIM|nr:hypothetical protein BJ508DRAFT_62764 [Ascobolus immersus RN42]
MQPHQTSSFGKPALSFPLNRRKNISFPSNSNYTIILTSLSQNNKHNLHHLPTKHINNNLQHG